MHIYLYDQTERGFYTAVFEAYADPLARVMRSGDYVQLGIDDVPMPVTNDENKAKRVVKKVSEYDRAARKEIAEVLKNGRADAPHYAFLYIRLLMKYRAPVRLRLNEEAALGVQELLRQNSHERERLCGFLRFRECEGGVLYAPCAPDNDVLEGLIPHFVRRYASLRFILHDVKRKKAVLYDGEKRRTLVVPLERAEILPSDEEEAFCSLWKTYYDSVSIAERKNTRQMKASLPVRYWKFMPEKGGL